MYLSFSNPETVAQNEFAEHYSSLTKESQTLNHWLCWCNSLSFVVIIGIIIVIFEKILTCLQRYTYICRRTDILQGNQTEAKNKLLLQTFVSPEKQFKGLGVGTQILPRVLLRVFMYIPQGMSSTSSSLSSWLYRYSSSGYYFHVDVVPSAECGHAAPPLWSPWFFFISTSSSSSLHFFGFLYFLSNVYKSKNIYENKDVRPSVRLYVILWSFFLLCKRKIMFFDTVE